MHEYDTTTEDAEEAIRKIRLLDHFGDLGWVTIGGEVDVDNLLEMAIQDHGLGDELDEQEDYTPEEIVDLAEENDVPLVQIMKVAGDRIDAMFLQTPSAEALGLEGTPETVINQTVREALESLSEDESEEKSDSSSQPLTGRVENAETSESRGETGDWESEGHTGSSRSDVEIEGRVSQGDRKEETLDFLKENQGEWVSTLEYVEYGDFSQLSTGVQRRNAASAALHRAVSRGWVEDENIETRKNGQVKEYRYSPNWDPSKKRLPEGVSISSQDARQFLEENRGDWVDFEDFRVYLDFSSEIHHGPFAGPLSKLAGEEEIVETRNQDGKRQEYRIPAEESESGSEEEEVEEDHSPSEHEGVDKDGGEGGKSETEGIPGQVSKGTQQHETLALLTHLADRYEEPQTIHDLADTGRRETQQYSNALNALKGKNLVALERGSRSSNEPGEWRPTQAGRAELKRTGGFQLNNDYGEE